MTDRDQGLDQTDPSLLAEQQEAIHTNGTEPGSIIKATLTPRVPLTTISIRSLSAEGRILKIKASENDMRGLHGRPDRRTPPINGFLDGELK